MLIYSIKNRLFIHSKTIIHVGHVDIIKDNKKLLRYKLTNTDFFSCMPDLSPDYYTVSIYSEKGKVEEKRVFLSNDYI